MRAGPGSSASPTRSHDGQGVQPFRDPALADDFRAERQAIDVGAWHTYAAEWLDDRVIFSVDGGVTRMVPQSPAYPMQMMIGVFDFPDRAVSDHDGHVPPLLVDEVRGVPRSP